MATTNDKPNNNDPMYCPLIKRNCEARCAFYAGERVPVEQAHSSHFKTPQWNPRDCALAAAAKAIVEDYE